MILLIVASLQDREDFHFWSNRIQLMFHQVEETIVIGHETNLCFICIFNGPEVRLEMKKKNPKPEVDRKLAFKYDSL